MTPASESHSVDIYDIAGHLWETANHLRANSDLKALSTCTQWVREGIANSRLPCV